jgi:glycosyltransferase involved in cell wall biosynthesis
VSGEIAISGRAPLNPIRVMFAISQLDATGGAGRSLAELIAGVRQAGVVTEFACFQRSSTGLEDEFQRAGGRVHILGADHLLRAVWKLRRLILARRPHILHTTLYAADQAGRLAAWRTPTRVVSSIVNPTHDPSVIADPTCSPWRRRTLWAIDGFTARHFTARLHAITGAVKESAVRGLRVSSDHVTVVYRSRDLRRLGQRTAERRARVRQNLGLGDGPVVLTIGRQEPQKGQMHLVEAWPGVLAHHSDATLLVAGVPGSMTAALEGRVSTLGIADQVTLLGHRDDIGDLLAAADIFAFPSMYEGLGGAVIEAMALETPIVASALPAVREITGNGDAAVLVPPGDEDALAAGIRRLLADPALAKGIAVRGRQRYDALFTPERVSADLVNLYRDVIGERTEASDVGAEYQTI